LHAGWRGRNTSHDEPSPALQKPPPRTIRRLPQLNLVAFRIDDPAERRPAPRLHINAEMILVPSTPLRQIMGLEEDCADSRHAFHHRSGKMPFGSDTEPRKSAAQSSTPLD